MKLTPIFPQHIKPVREGVYRVSEFVGIPQYSYWNGMFWGNWFLSPESAYKYRNVRSPYQNKRWRGLAEEPKK